MLYCVGLLIYTNTLLVSQKRYGEAELLFVKAQSIQEKALGPDHPEVSFTLNNRAGLFKKQVGAESQFRL